MTNILNFNAMEDLLLIHFVAHYGVAAPTIVNFILETDSQYFEIDDSLTRDLDVTFTRNSGTAKFQNNSKLKLSIANYDKFVTQLPAAFQTGRKRCDFLMSGDAADFFIIGELKDRIPKSKVRSDAKKQIISTLQTILSVPAFHNYINSKLTKRSIYFNKQATAPSILTATTAFGRLPNLFPDGFKMSAPVIEGYGFEFYEYSGNQTMTLN